MEAGKSGRGLKEGDECGSYRGINLLCGPGKEYGRHLTARLIEIAEDKENLERVKDV